MTLHLTALLVRTLHRSEPSIGSPFLDLKNHLCLLPGSMTDPANQHQTFQHIVSLHTPLREISQKVTYPITTPNQACLTMKFLSDGLPKSRYILLV